MPIEAKVRGNVIRIIAFVELAQLWMVPAVVYVIGSALYIGGPNFPLLLFGPMCLLFGIWRIALARRWWRGGDLGQGDGIFRPVVQLLLDVPMTWFVLAGLLLPSWMSGVGIGLAASVLLLYAATGVGRR